jgi:hypothetical protein
MGRLRIPAIVFVMVLGGCGNAAEEALEGARELSIAVCDPGTGSFSTDITNEFLPLAANRRWVLEGREGGAVVRVEMQVLEELQVVAGVETRIFEEREFEDGELIEVSRNFVAQASDGSVCYFGEDVEDYEDGRLVGSAGAWRAGEDGAVPGILMPAAPEVGTSHRQEVAPGVAEDASVVVALGEPVTVPAGAFTDTLTVRDVDPLGGGVDEKQYARDVGPVRDAGLLLIEFTY